MSITGTLYVREQTPPTKLPKGMKLYQVMGVICAPEGIFDNETLIPMRSNAIQDAVDPSMPVLELNPKMHMDTPTNTLVMTADQLFYQQMWRV